MNNPIGQNASSIVLPQHKYTENSAPLADKQRFLAIGKKPLSSLNPPISSIGVGQRLYQGNSLASENGRYTAVFNGINLIVYDHRFPNEEGVLITIDNNGNEITESGNPRSNYIEVTAEGNLEVKTEGGNVLWSTETGMDFESEYLYNGEEHVFTLELLNSGYLKLTHDNDDNRYLWDSRIYKVKPGASRLYLGDINRFLIDEATGEFVLAGPNHKVRSNESILIKNLERLELELSLDFNGDGIGKVTRNPNDPDIKAEILQALEGLEAYYGIDFGSDGLIGNLELDHVITFINEFKTALGIDLLSRARMS